jgi:hypothetical protein
MGRIVIVFAVAVLAVLVAYWLMPPTGTLGVAQ